MQSDSNIKKRYADHQAWYDLDWCCEQIQDAYDSIDIRYRDAGLNSAELFLANNGNTPNYLRTIDYVQTGLMQKHSILFHGISRSGKTCTAIAIVIYARVIYGKEIHIVSEEKLFRELRNIYESRKRDENSSKAEQKLIESLKKHPYLFLDDFGLEPDNKVYNRIISEIISARHFDKLATIFTTNLSPEDIKMIYKDRLLGRIYEMTNDDQYYLKMQ
jgi:DNA replication protein DnaC